MKRFRKSGSTAGFSHITVDKMFAISGGSLTAWGYAHLGDRSIGGYIQQNEWEYNHTTGYYDLLTTKRYFVFNANVQSRAGCARVQVNLHHGV